MAPNDPVHLRGPVLVRRDKGGERTTTDQRLLDKNQDTDWLHTDPWRVLRIQSEFVEGFDTLADVTKGVTIFGSARTGPDDPYRPRRDDPLAPRPRHIGVFQLPFQP